MPLFTDPPAPYPEGWDTAENIAAGRAGTREAGSVDRLMAQLDGAQLVKYDADGFLFAWHGGSGVHVYDASGTEVHYFMLEDKPSPQQVLDAIGTKITFGWDSDE